MAALKQFNGLYPENRQLIDTGTTPLSATPPPGIVEDKCDIRRLPPGDLSGCGFAFGYNFPGPGWSGVFRTRPLELFDLAGKLHDAAYTLNGLSVNLTGSRDPMSQSRKERADMMFRIMNNHARFLGLQNTISKIIFNGRDRRKFHQGDGYESVLSSKNLKLLNNPKEYLMIPYSEIIGDKPTEFSETQKYPSSQPTFSVTKGVSKTIYAMPGFLTPVPQDTDPGFIRWFKQKYAAVWPDLISI